MSSENTIPRETVAAFDRQLAYTLSGEAGKDGSAAIAYGRAAGLAKQLGLDNTAKVVWDMLDRIAPEATRDRVNGMPNLEQFAAGFNVASAEKTQRFGDKAIYPQTEGLALSNALGSYAFALDYMRRGKGAIVNGGEPQWIADHGAAALRAAGFEEAAKKIDALKNQEPAKVWAAAASKDTAIKGK